MANRSKARESDSVLSNESAFYHFIQVMTNASCNKPAVKAFITSWPRQGMHHFLVADIDTANKSFSFDSAPPDV